MTKPYAIRVDHSQRLIRVNYQGGIDLANAAVMTAEARDLANRHRFQLLYDFREARITASLTAVGEFPSHYVAPVTGDHPLTASANIICSDDNLEYWHFYGRACETAGIIWQAFFDEASALAWLKTQQELL